MKRNKVPEKIYMSAIDLENMGDCIREPLDKYDIEYTRTDALIDKACVKLKKLMYDNLMFQGRLHREEVIDNFIETFKNYMKGG